MQLSRTQRDPGVIGFHVPPNSIPFAAPSADPMARFAPCPHTSGCVASSWAGWLTRATPQDLGVSRGVPAFLGQMVNGLHETLNMQVTALYTGNSEDERICKPCVPHRRRRSGGPEIRL